MYMNFYKYPIRKRHFQTKPNLKEPWVLFHSNEYQKTACKTSFGIWESLCPFYNVL